MTSLSQRLIEGHPDRTRRMITLRHEQYRIARFTLFQRPTDDLLDLAHRVGIAGVDDVDSRCDSSVDDRVAFLFVSRLHERLRSQTNGRDLHSCSSELAMFHRSIPIEPVIHQNAGVSV